MQEIKCGEEGSKCKCRGGEVGEGRSQRVQSRDLANWGLGKTNRRLGGENGSHKAQTSGEGGG